MDSALDQLERAPGSDGVVGAKNRTAGETKIGRAKDAGRSIRNAIQQNRRTGKSWRINHSCAGGFARHRLLASGRTRSAAVRLRAMRARPCLQAIAGLD